MEEPELLKLEMWRLVSGPVENDEDINGANEEKYRDEIDLLNLPIRKGVVAHGIFHKGIANLLLLQNFRVQTEPLSTPKNFSFSAQLRGQFLRFEGRSVSILVLLGTAIFIRRRSSVSQSRS